ncbi:MAG: hypothetical protein II776_00895 [Clostridia bacterium]|nr:hypothetical protein [Clostridia bacterium]
MKEMREILLRGYVTPEECEGSDRERLQAAMDLAHETDLNKVIVTGDYKVDGTVYVHPRTEIIFRNALIQGEGTVFANTAVTRPETDQWCYVERYFYFKGENARIIGDLFFRNTKNVVLETLDLAGTLKMEYVTEARLDRVKFEGDECLVLGRGCNNFIMQSLFMRGKKDTIVLDTSRKTGGVVVGEDPEIHDIIFNDCECLTPASAVALYATETDGIYNIQIDHIKSAAKAVTIGKPGAELPAERYFNLTAINLETDHLEKICLNNPVKHAYFPD